MNLRVYCDGAGAGKWGWYAEDKNGIQGFEVGYMGPGATTNEAEYASLVNALHWLTFQEVYLWDTVIVQMDSQLIVRQIKGEWKVRAKNLKAFYHEAREFFEIVDDWMAVRSDHKNEKRIIIDWEPRMENIMADRLSRVPDDIAKGLSWDISR